MDFKIDVVKSQNLTLYGGFYSKRLAFKLKRQYLNDYRIYHHDRHTVGKVFSLRIQSHKVQRKTFSNTNATSSWVKEVEGWEPKKKADRSWPVEQLRSSFFRESTACLLGVICCMFRDVSNYHCKAVSEVVAAAHVCLLLNRKKMAEELGHFIWL